jgi:hypothetical protein
VSYHTEDWVSLGSKALLLLNTKPGLFIAGFLVGFLVGWL